MSHMKSEMLCGTLVTKPNVSRHKKACVSCSKIQKLMDDLADANKTIELLKGLQNQGQTINYVDNRHVNRVENIQQNITIYGTEKLPDAKRQLRKLCRKHKFDECVPRYIQMKHFPEGNGNIRFDSDNNCLEIFEKNGWIRVDKDSELSNLTRLGSQEVIERYEKDMYVNFFKNYALKQLENEESNEFRNVRQKVEHVIRNGNSYVDSEDSE
mgnify:CR=1 FL=1